MAARVLMAEEGTEAALRTRDIWTSALADNVPTETPREWPLQFATRHRLRTGSKGS